MAMLNLREICKTQARSSSKNTLRKPSLFSVLTDGCPKGLEQHNWITWLSRRCDVMGHHRIQLSSRVNRVADGGRSQRSVRVQLGKQTDSGYVQGMRKTKQCQYGNIMLTQFNSTEILATHTRLCSKCSLAQALLLPVLTERRPKAL